MVRNAAGAQFYCDATPIQIVVSQNTATNTPAAGLANLTMSGSFTVGTSLGINQPIPVSFTMINNGTATANPSQYQYTNQSNGISTIATQNTCVASTSLAPGQACVSSYTFTFSTAGSKTLSIKMDSNNVITESNENDNIFSTTFTIPTTGSTATPPPGSTNTPIPSGTIPDNLATGKPIF